MTTITKYTATRTDEGLLISGVIMAVTGTPSGKPELTAAMMSGFVTNFDMRLSRGSIGAYVLLDHDGPRVGRIVALAHQGNELIGDLLITDPEVADRVEDADLSDISISFFPEDQVLVDVSLLDNAFGALSDVIPPLLVDVLQEFGITSDNKIEYKYQAPNKRADRNAGHTKELTMDLTPDQLNKMIADAVSNAMKSAKPASEPVNEKKLNEALAKVAKKELDITVDGYVRNLISRGGYSGAGLKTRFEAFGENTEAMEVEYKRLMEKSTEDVKLEMEAEYEAPSLDDSMKSEWEAYKVTYKSEIDFNTYKEVLTGANRADLGNKPINYVAGSIRL